METFRGTLDLPLNEKGKEQAGKLAVAFTRHEPVAVYSSPLVRAIDTADGIAEPHLLPVLQEYRFIDLDFGQWQGKLVSEVKKLYPDTYREWRKNPYHAKIPGGGDISKLAKNAYDALLEIAERHKNDEVIIVTHRLVLKLLICSALGMGESGFWKIRLDCGSISLLEYTGKNFILSLLNDTCHLDSTTSKPVDF
ncbi:MAG: histidine phosphatase family protein [Candidatus Eremiobacteraeota bacterium]|nr:histidine phosphatase family protein [Candidatus Eremiobacteraeota bacterium]